MKRVVELPDRSFVAEEAAAWLIRLDSDTPPTREDLQELGEWLHRSLAHREQLESLATLWNRMNVLTDLAVPMEKQRRPAAHTRPETPAVPTSSLWGRNRLRALLVAASLVVAIAIGFLLSVREPATDPLLATNGLYMTAVGQQKDIRLADGSEIMLNTDSEIRVDYGEKYREVQLLQGEALFTVAKNATRPFRVYAGNGVIEALGTAFSVYLNGEDVNIAVAEGHVSLASVDLSPAKILQPSTSVGRLESVGPSGDIGYIEDVVTKPLGTLKAGQVATIRSSVAGAAADGASAVEVMAPIPPRELAERLAWREGILMFSGNTLEEVVNEIGRYTTVSIEIPDTGIRSMRIGGRFPVGEIETMLAALETNFNLRVTRLSHNRVVLSAANE